MVRKLVHECLGIVLNNETIYSSSIQNPCCSPEQAAEDGPSRHEDQREAKRANERIISTYLTQLCQVNLQRLCTIFES
jgi:hypothetical protein